MKDKTQSLDNVENKEVNESGEYLVDLDALEQGEEPVEANVAKAGSGELEINPDLEINHTLVSRERFERIKNLSQRLDKGEPMFSIESQYKEFETPGESCRGVFLGFQEITIKGRREGEEPRVLKSVKWFEANGKTYINSGAQLVGIIERSNIPGDTAIEIKYIGKKPSQNNGGDVKMYEVFILDVGVE
jgi:hypothetical protein